MGVLARAAPRGRALLGYFFGPKLQSESEVDLERLKPEDSLLTTIFGDLGIINGEWQIIDCVPNWDRSLWPIPDFVRRDPIGKRAWRVRYCADDPSKIESETPIDFSTDLPPDYASGYGAVALKLERLLGDGD